MKTSKILGTAQRVADQATPAMFTCPACGETYPAERRRGIDAPDGSVVVLCAACAATAFR